MALKCLSIVLILIHGIFAIPPTPTGRSTEVSSNSSISLRGPSGWDSLFSSNTTSLVQLFHSGGKSYYFSFVFKATYFQAAQFCEDIHMKLVSIESAAENDRLYKYVRDANKGDLFWTSGSRLLDGKHWVWMSKGKPVEYINWAPGNPTTLTAHCMAVFHTKNVGLTWFDKDCLITMGFICERKTLDNTNEVETETTWWTSVYENPYVSPNIPLFHTTNKSYFVGRNFKATYQESVQLCDMMKMKLVAITSKEENDRIYKYIRDTNAGDGFWTSGARIIDGTTWIWMTSAQLVDYTNWYAAQPDSITDHCIQLLAQKDKGLFWLDSNCATRLLYICEKPKEIMSFQGKPVDEGKQSSSYLKNIHIDLIQMEHRSYYLGTDFRLTQFEASHFCRRQNMRLISITSEQANEEIRQLLLHYAETTTGFWTSARKVSEKDKWTWASGTPLTFTSFDDDHEDARSNAYCVEVFNNATWNQQVCDQKRFFICERIMEDKQLNTCPKVQPVLNVYVNGTSTPKNFSLPYGYFSVGNATFHTDPVNLE